MIVNIAFRILLWFNGSPLLTFSISNSELTIPFCLVLNAIMLDGRQIKNVGTINKIYIQPSFGVCKNMLTYPIMRSYIQISFLSIPEEREVIGGGGVDGEG